MASYRKSKDNDKERHCVTLVWRIENVGFLEGKRVWWTAVSPDFRSRSLGGNRFSLGLIPKYICGDINEVSLEFGITEGSLDYPIDIEWAFIGRNETVLASRMLRNTVILPDGYTPLPGSLSHKEVFSTRRSEFLPYDTLTIQCCVWKSEGDLGHIEFISGQTRLEPVEEAFLWPVCGFGGLPLREWVTAPVTLGEPKDTEGLTLVCSLEGSSLADSVVNVGLVRLPTAAPLVITMRASVLDKDRKVAKCRECGPQYFIPQSKCAWLIPNFASRQYLVNNCVTEDVLNLFCEVTTIRYTDSITKSYYGYLEPGIPRNGFSRLKPPKQCIVAPSDVLVQEEEEEETGAPLIKDLLKMCKDRVMPDFELCSDDVSFPVHKSVLSVGSPVFSAMFSSGMREASSGSLDIPDLDAQTLDRMLTFLYTGTLEPELAWQDAARLYYAADKYHVLSLKDHCSSILSSSVSVTTMSDIIALADMHQDKELKCFVHKFVMSNFSEVLCSKEWKDRIISDYAFASNNANMLQFYKSKNLKRP